MGSMNEDWNDKVGLIVQSLGAQPGSNFCWVGLVGKVPFLFKTISVDPPTLMFKFRVLKQEGIVPKEDLAFNTHLGALGVKCEFEGAYMWVWIRKPQAMTGVDIAGLVRECVNHYAENFPTASGHCHVCGENRDAVMVQEGDGIGAVCSICLAEAVSRKNAREQEMNRSNGFWALLLPLGIALGAFGWGVFWYAYEKMFEILGVETLILPSIIIFVVAVGIAFCVGWPIGKLLRLSGTSRVLTRVVFSILATIIIATLGEVFFISLYLLPQLSEIPLVSLLHAAFELLLASGVVVIVTKLIFVLCLGMVVYNVAAPKKAKLGI